MPTLTKTQRRLIAQIRAKLDINDPNFAGSTSIRAAFTPEIPRDVLGFRSLETLRQSEAWAVAGLYIHSWILPLLDELEGVADAPRVHQNCESCSCPEPEVKD